MRYENAFVRRSQCRAGYCVVYECLLRGVTPVQRTSVKCHSEGVAAYGLRCCVASSVPNEGSATVECREMLSSDN